MYIFKAFYLQDKMWIQASAVCPVRYEHHLHTKTKVIPIRYRGGP
jgi:hypothetical protein